MDVKFDGLTSTEKYLTVYITVRQDNWIQFGSVKIPLTRLLEQHITDHLDTVVRRQLVQAWSEPDLSDPLF